MKKLALFALLIGIKTGLFAQLSPWGLVYAISPDEALALYTEQDSVLESHLHTLADTSYWEENAELPPGHYLKISAEGETLNIELESVYSFQVQLVENGRDLIVQLLDSTGLPISNGQVWLEGRRLAYSPADEAYILRKCRRDGLLRVELQGEHAFFDMEDVKKESLARQRLSRFSSSRAGRVVTTPLRPASRVYWFFKRGFKYKQWTLFLRRYKPFKGYIALSKPMYRPGDTLQVKAFIANHRGRPQRRPMELTLRKTSAETYLFKSITPSSPGNYSGQVVLGDSLPLDAQYIVAIGTKKGRRYKSLAESFRLADYQLDEVQFEIHPQKEAFLAADTVRLLASAKGANGLPLPGGRLVLVAETGRLSDFQSGEALVPDTLWVYEQALLPMKETPVVVPDSIFPPASISAGVTAYFTAPGGELHKAFTAFNRSLAPEQLRLRLEDGWLVGQYFRHGLPDSCLALLHTKGEPGHALAMDTILLPFRLRLNPLAKAYFLSKGDLETYLYLHQGGGPGPGVQYSGRNEGGELSFRIDNPRRLPLAWFFYRRGQEVAHGYTADSLFTWNTSNPSGAHGRLVLQYTWAGAAKEESLSLPFYKKMLQVSVEQPQRVAPNQEAPIKISVRDSKGKPVAGVGLVAGAIRSQFTNGANYELPTIEYRRPKAPLIYNDYQLTPHQHRYFNQTITPAWYRRFGLQAQQYYRLRHPDGGIRLEYDSLAQDSFYRNIAQFAPYIVRHGKEQPILLAYCNRKLVYYADTYTGRPYSFAAPEGKATLLLRTRQYEYTVEGVELRKGEKLEIAIDEQGFQQSEWAGRISRRAVQPHLDQQETALLNKSIFELKSLPQNAEIFIWQDGADIFHIQPNDYRNRSYLRFGPFSNNTPIHYVQRGAFESRLKFEPGFLYEVNEARDRLYESKTFVYNPRQKLSPAIPAPVHIPGQYVIRPQDIKRKNRLSARLRLPLMKFLPKTGIIRGHFQFRYQPEPDTLKLLAAVLANSDSLAQLLDFGGRSSVTLPAGTYALYLFRADGRYHQHSIRIRPDTLLYLDLSEAGFHPDSNNQLIQQFFFKGGLPEAANLKEAFGLVSEPPAFGTERYLIYGQATDNETGEPLIFASVTAYQNGVLVGGTDTDFEGNYQLWVPYGPVEVRISYVGYQANSLYTHSNYRQPLNIRMDAGGVALQEVMVTSDAVTIRGSRSMLTGMVNGIRVEAFQASTATISPDATQNELPGATEPIAWGDYSGLRKDFRDYAYWQPNLMTGRRGEAYFTARFPGDLTNWQSFAIGMDGRRRAGAGFGTIQSYKPLAAQLHLPRFLLAGDRANIAGQVANYTPDSLKVATYFQQGSDRLSYRESTIAEALSESVNITAPEGQDSVQYTYALEMDGFVDGEQRSIPVLPVGSAESVGQFALLEGDTSLEWRFGPGRGPVQVYAQSDILPLLLNDVRALKEYPYGCNEQTASRLLALLMERDIRQALGEPWAGGKAVLKAAGQLQQAQNPDGSWGWWPQGEANHWMTVYVLEALQRAGAAGYPTPAYERGMRYLANRLPDMELPLRLRALHLMAADGQNADLATWLAPYDTINIAITERLLVTAIAQQAGLPYSLDSLYRYRRSTALGNTYWGEQPGGWRDNTIQPTLLAYQALQRAGREGELPPIRRYLLEQRRPGRFGWRNTYETAQILATLLPDILKGRAAGPWEAHLVVNGKAYSDFPLSASLEPGQPLQISKTGAAPLYLAAYQTFFNRQPEARGGLFDIETALWQNGQPAGQLVQGLPVQLKVKLKASAAADYVMLEAPIPAGCSYFKEPNGRRGVEVHREYFRHQTAIFCEHLEPGEHEFVIELEPRFTGHYTINPAKAELMYFPVFFGRTGVKEVEVE
ncbi:MAG: carboxypeptidase-like regulatory domain-containing protein [Lewinellaceae bacterium]|nr:carboxypeptidase-like regulatory domain-containing protein [Lewinellaceae bacterium]